MSEDQHQSDVDFIAALAKMLREHELTEIEVNREYGEDDALNVRVARQITAAAPIAQVAAAPVAAATAAIPAPAAPAAATPPASDDPAQLPGAVTSPMVGTAYLQAEPGSPPFVKIGDVVEEGQTILIIEAMKTMNQIPAPRAGTVKRIVIEDGSPVEFGDPLIVLE